jgi:hypothetical protein
MSLRRENNIDIRDVMASPIEEIVIEKSLGR